MWLMWVCALSVKKIEGNYWPQGQPATLTLIKNHPLFINDGLSRFLPGLINFIPG
jgi:hypothetical protein